MARDPELTNSQLFLDDRWVDDVQRLTRIWHKADIYPEPLVRADKPWETRGLVFYGTVLRLGDTWRMYYCAERDLLCLAESDNGLQWRKPSLGLVDFQGSRENNIVFQGILCPSVMHDPEDTDAPFKMVTQGKFADRPAIQGLISPDGLNWSWLDEPLIPKPPASDVQYLWPRKAGGKYIITHKTSHGQKLARRCVAIAESEDFRSFSDSHLILKSDLADPADIEYHGMVGFPYGDMYLGMAERWVNSPGIMNHIELLLTWSHDRRPWHQPAAREPFIGPTYPWNRGWNTCNSAGPILEGNQLWFYFGGKSGSHFHVKAGPLPFTSIGLATITVDRFASITAGFREGRLVTRPMSWPGGDLLLNASTTRHFEVYPRDGGGSMFIEVWDESGQPVDGFCDADRAVFEGNIPTRGYVDPATILWPGDRSLNDLRGRIIRLVFTMQDSHLFSFRSSRG